MSTERRIVTTILTAEELARMRTLTAKARGPEEWDPHQASIWIDRFLCAPQWPSPRPMWDGECPWAFEELTFEEAWELGVLARKADRQ